MLADKLNADQAALTRLGQISEGEAGRDLLAVVEREQRAMRDKVETEPRSCEDDIRKDFRFVAGRLSLARELLALPAAAKEKLAAILGEQT